MSSIINNKDRAKLWTKTKLSRCDLFRSLSNVNSVIPMIPFIGVLQCGAHEQSRGAQQRRCVPDLVRHVSQELGFTPVGQFGGFPGSGVLLDTISQVEDHLVDLRLQRVHLSTSLDRDETTEVSVCGGGRDLRETTHLRRQVVGHGIDGVSIVNRGSSCHC